MRTWSTLFFLLAFLLVLTILWFPGTGVPIVSDTAIYALLGESFWTEGTYALFGEPHAKYLPFHAIISYPLVSLFGYQWGMHVSSLLGGWGVLITTFFLLRRLFSQPVAILGVLGVLFHPAFVFMTMRGGADLLFITLFYGSLLSFLQAEEDERWYVMAGVLAGLSCLTRYNGAPLFLLYFGWVVWQRRSHLRSPWFWGGMIGGGGIFGTWFVRNAIVFGDPFFTDYTSELSDHAPSLLDQFFSNIAFYLNPFHNILPFLLPFAFYGLWKQRRSQSFAVLAILSAWVLTAVWWVQAMRFAFPGYPLLIGFAAWGIVDLWRRLPRLRWLFVSVCTAGFLAVHIPSLCLYTYGACNSWFDRSVGGIPKDLGLTSEGVYTWEVARKYLNVHAQKDAYIAGFPFPVLQKGYLRSDLRPVDEYDTANCPVYRLTQIPKEDEVILFTTEAAPQTSVVTLERCM